MEPWQKVLNEAAGRFGLLIPEWRQRSLESRITEFLGSLPVNHPRDMAGATVSGQLADLFSVQESSFFRERIQLDYLETLLRSRQTTPPVPWRILSAGCAGGEEAVSLAICLHRNGYTNSEVTGWDFSPTAIRRAQQAIYHDDGRLFRFVNDETWQTCFQKLSDRTWQPVDAIRRMTRYELRNLAEIPIPGITVNQEEQFDAIFCRNVFIYLNEQTRKRVLRSFQRMLVPGGKLFLGISDCIPEINERFTADSTRTPSVWIHHTPDRIPPAVIPRESPSIPEESGINRNVQNASPAPHTWTPPPPPREALRDTPPDRNRPLQLAGWKLEIIDDIHLVQLDGFIDLESGSPDSQRFQQLPVTVRNQDIRRLILETGNLKFICHRSIGSMIHLLQTLRNRGGDLKFIVTRTDLRQYFTRQYFDRIFDLCGNRQEALQAFCHDRNHHEQP